MCICTSCISISIVLLGRSLTLADMLWVWRDEAWTASC